MATFECKVYKLTIEEHPNADAIEIARVGDYMSIVQKGQFKTGDLGVYIPEAAVVPDAMIERMGLSGKLAGKDKNRVKAIKLRGILSQGLIYPVEFREGCVETNTGAEKGKIKDIHCVTLEEGGAGHKVEEGYDVTEFLGVTKYEPVIPSSMSGEVYNAFGATLKYDIENIKRYPDVFEPCEQVVFTEKLHGTWCCFGYHPDYDYPIITSKGLSDKGLALIYNDDDDTNKNNLYVQMFERLSTMDGTNILEEFLMVKNYDFDQWEEEGNKPFYILGEIFGQGVQDLTYGLDHPEFRIFDIYIGEPGKGEYLSYHHMVDWVDRMDIQVRPVPALYDGPYSDKVVRMWTDGKDTISAAHIREGIVIRPEHERKHDEVGRVILKSVSEDYLLRKGGTEYN